LFNDVLQCHRFSFDQKKRAVGIPPVVFICGIVT
jgi:hypothetical protein